MAKQKEKKWYQKTGDWLEKWVEPAVEIGKWIPGPQQPFVWGADLAFDAEDIYSEARKGNYKGAALEGLGLLRNPMAGTYVEGTKLGKYVPDALTELDKIPTDLKGGLWRGGKDAITELAKAKLSGGDAVSQVADAGAFDDYANAYLTDTMQGASAVGQMMGQSLNRRGLGGSPLAAGLQSQAMNQALGRATSELAKMRLGYQQGQQQLKTQEQMQSDQMLYQMLSMFAMGGLKIADKAGLFDNLFGGGDGVNLEYDPGPAGIQNDPSLTPLGNRFTYGLPPTT